MKFLDLVRDRLQRYLLRRECQRVKAHFAALGFPHVQFLTDEELIEGVLAFAKIAPSLGVTRQEVTEVLCSPDFEKASEPFCKLNR